MRIDAELLLNYQRCNRRAFLDVHGDLSQRDPPNDYLLKILQDSQANQHHVVSRLSICKPHYPTGDLEAGFQATLALMQQGVDRIYQGVLLADAGAGDSLVSIPDLLLKLPGKSYFGDWIYEPVEIKLGKRPKLEYQVLAAFHVYVLAQVQGAWSETTRLILRERGEFEVDLWEMLPRMQEILEGCIQSLQQRQEPEVFIARNRCSMCHWFGHCYTIAKNVNHLSLLPGVTPIRYLQLQDLNLTTVRALAEADPTQLEPLPGFGSDAAHKLVRQARSVLQNRAFFVEEALEYPLSNGSTGDRAGNGTHHTLLPGGELPSAAVELYFDIEAEPTLNLVYLHGVLVVDRHARSQTFYPLMAEHPQEEAHAWQQFLDLVWSYPSAPIFHFCPFEVQTVERLAKLYNTPVHRVKPLLSRFFDLHDWVTRTVTLPVESYALKQIARWLGFHWRDPAANGAQSIYWYTQWLATGDRTYLNSILAYNEDDCRATYHIKDWLAGFLQATCEAERA
jgi:uncharacterized protein